MAVNVFFFHLENCEAHASVFFHGKALSLKSYVDDVPSQYVTVINKTDLDFTTCTVYKLLCVQLEHWRC